MNKLKLAILFLLIDLVFAGCASKPRYDNWHYIPRNQFTAAHFIKGDCYISRVNDNCYVVFFCVGDRYINFNTFKTLEEAKRAAGNLNK